jgi:myo-inositol 2-dehydrogenase/D-chiro-inositol 1-dehydrogenase
MVGFNLRWHRLVLRARNIIRAGSLGRIQGARTIFTGGSATKLNFPRWRGRRALGGGVFIDLAVHHFDLLRFLLGGEIEEVYAQSHSDQRDDVSAVVIWRMEGEILVNSFFSECATSRNEIEIFGERGSLLVSCHRFDGLAWYPFPASPDAIEARLKRTTQSLKELPGGFLRKYQGGDYRQSFFKEWRHFVEAVRHDKPVAYQLREGRQAMAAVFAAIQSATLGKSVNPADVPKSISPKGENEEGIDGAANQV